jgi:hypothetical protein
MMGDADKNTKRVKDEAQQEEATEDCDTQRNRREETNRSQETTGEQRKTQKVKDSRSGVDTSRKEREATPTKTQF